MAPRSPPPWWTSVNCQMSRAQPQRPQSQNATRLLMVKRSIQFPGSILFQQRILRNGTVLDVTTELRPGQYLLIPVTQNCPGPSVRPAKGRSPPPRPAAPAHNHAAHLPQAEAQTQAQATGNNTAGRPGHGGQYRPDHPSLAKRCPVHAAGQRHNHTQL
jgi:hypothetical protein